jgi:hypothetical protein
VDFHGIGSGIFSWHDLSPWPRGAVVIFELWNRPRFTAHSKILWLLSAILRWQAGGAVRMTRGMWLNNT